MKADLDREREKLDAAWGVWLEACRTYSALKEMYEENLNPELGESLLAAILDHKKKSSEEQAARADYTRAYEAFAAVQERLLKHKPKRPKPSSLEGTGPVRVAMLQGWSHGLPGDEDSYGGVVISWTKPGVGFGELTLAQEPDGTLVAETECMGPKFVREVLEALVKQVKVVE